MYTWKTNEHGEVVGANARLVARDFKQREGIDFFEIFASTPAASCFRLLAGIAYELDLGLCHFDMSRHSSSRIWMRMFLCVYVRVAVKCPVR